MVHEAPLDDGARALLLTPDPHHRGEFGVDGSTIPTARRFAVLVRAAVFAGREATLSVVHAHDCGSAGSCLSETSTHGIPRRHPTVLTISIPPTKGSFRRDWRV